MKPKQGKEFWEFLKKTAEIVDSWPEWMKGERVPLRQPILNKDEIQSINDYQKAGFIHPLTCGNSCGDLIATPDGLFCPVCKEVQTWCPDDIKNGDWRQAAEIVERLTKRKK